MSDGGIVTAEVNGFTVDSNTAGSKEKLQANLRVKPSEEVSKAGSELGKLGGKAAAEKRAEAKATEEQTERKPIKPIPPKQEEKPEVEAKAEEPEPAEAEAKPAEELEKQDKRGDPRHDPKARMLEATRKEAEAKRALAAERESKQALESRIAALEAEVRKATAEVVSAPYDTDDARGRLKAAKHAEAKPRLEDFVKDAETYEEAQEAYLEARDAWRDRQSQQKREEEAIVTALDSQVGKFREAASKHMDSYSGEVLSLKTEFQLRPDEQPTGANWLANELVFSPGTAPSLMLYLSEHPDELQRIAALPNPRAVSREVAKLETRLEAAPAGDSTNRDDDVSRAAPPVRPVTGKPYVTEDGYRPGMDLDEYVRMRKRQTRSAR